MLGKFVSKNKQIFTKEKAKLRKTEENIKIMFSKKG